MGILQIVFVAINLYVPYWLWTKGASEAPVKVAWPAAESTIARVLDASGGLNCPTATVVKHIRKLCDQSMSDWEESESVAYRQQLGNQFYSCEVRKGSVQIKIAPDAHADKDEPCQAKDDFKVLHYSPGFVLTLAGFVSAMSYVGIDQERHSFSVRNCRRKLKVHIHSSAATPEALDEELGQDLKDPAEFRVANRLCWVYDNASGWKVFRDRFRVSGS